MSTLYSIESTVDSYEYPTRHSSEYLPGDSSEYTLDSDESQPTYKYWLDSTYDENQFLEDLLKDNFSFDE